MIVVMLMLVIGVRIMAILVVRLYTLNMRLNQQRPMQPKYQAVLEWAVYFAVIIPIFRALP